MDQPNSAQEATERAILAELAQAGFPYDDLFVMKGELRAAQARKVAPIMARWLPRADERVLFDGLLANLVGARGVPFIEVVVGVLEDAVAEGDGYKENMLALTLDQYPTAALVPWLPRLNAAAKAATSDYARGMLASTIECVNSAQPSKSASRTPESNTDSHEALELSVEGWEAEPPPADEALLEAWWESEPQLMLTFRLAGETTPHGASVRPKQLAWFAAELADPDVADLTLSGERFEITVGRGPHSATLEGWIDTGSQTRRISGTWDAAALAGVTLAFQDAVERFFPSEL